MQLPWVSHGVDDNAIPSIARNAVAATKNYRLLRRGEHRGTQEDCYLYFAILRGRS
jgi:hypothetical protein